MCHQPRDARPASRARPRWAVCEPMRTPGSIRQARLRGAAVLLALGVVRLEALVRLAARCFGASDAEEIVGVVAGGLLAATRASATARAAAVGGLIGPPVHDTL